MKLLKVLSVLAIFGLVFAFAACGSSSSGDSTSPPGPGGPGDPGGDGGGDNGSGGGGSGGGGGDSGPDGTSGNPFIVRTADDLGKVGTGSGGWGLAAHYVQRGNITLSASWTPIGTEASPFTGSYDGDYFTISNLNCSVGASDRAGMFGTIGSG